MLFLPLARRLVAMPAYASSNRLSPLLEPAQLRGLVVLVLGHIVAVRTMQ